MASAPNPGVVEAPEASVHDSAHHHTLAGTALAALGVVYGDIGTSPLYALKECFAPEYGIAPTAPNVLSNRTPRAAGNRSCIASTTPLAAPAERTCNTVTDQPWHRRS